jgi:surface polysaccharide O-acyltransferase-like enzyme
MILGHRLDQSEPMRTPISLPDEKHDLGLDLVKIFATLLVILTHVNMNGTGAFSPMWQSSNVLNAIARPCVPFFIMVTGALLLPRVDDLKKLSSRILRIAVIMVTWSLITYLYFRLRGNSIPFTIPEIERCAFPLWYLKMLLAAYLFLPLMQLFYRDASRAWMIGVCSALFMLFFFLTTTDEINGSSFSGQYNFYVGQFNFGYFLYFIAGALCANLTLTRQLGVIALILFVVSTASTALGTVWLSQARGAPAVALIRYLSPTVMFQAISGFLVIRAAARLLPATWTSAIRNLAGLTLGVYVMHIMVLELVQFMGLSIYTFWIWLSAPATTLAVFVIAAVITHILRSSKLSRIIVT